MNGIFLTQSRRETETQRNRIQIAPGAVYIALSKKATCCPGHQQFQIWDVIASPGRFSRGEAIPSAAWRLLRRKKTLLAMTDLELLLDHHQGGAVLFQSFA